MAHYRVGQEVVICTERYVGAHGKISEISRGWLRIDLGLGIGFVSVRRSWVRPAYDGQVEA